MTTTAIPLDEVLTAKKLRDKLATYPEDTPVCGSYDGRSPVLDLIPSLGEPSDRIVVAALVIGNDKHVDVEFDRSNS